MMNGGIYISLPFCLSHCHYCSNPATPFASATAANYLAAVQDELIRHAPDWAHHTIDSLYLGGGTPTLFSAGQIANLLDTVRRHYRVSADAEVTTEANPETVDAALAADWVQLGVNRISIGAQSFRARHLIALGRRHDVAAIAPAVAAARDGGFTNLSLDLIFGINGQDQAEWVADLHTAAALAPDHIAAYILTLEAGTVLDDRVTAGRTKAPDEALCTRLYGVAVATLRGLGYRRYEVSNFSRPGKQCRHNRRYWQLGDWLGVGTGAASALGPRRWANAASLEQYGCRSGQPVESLDLRQRAHEAALFGMRTTEGIDLNGLAERFGHAALEGLPEALEKLCDQGLVKRQNSRFVPTDKGFIFNDSIGAALAP